MAQVQIDKDAVFRDELLKLAKERYGDVYESDDQYLFGLACDVVRVVAAEGEHDAQAGYTQPIIETDEGTIALELGSITENVAPQYIVGRDAVIAQPGWRVSVVPMQ
jgi:hypothetical protein